MRLEWFRKLDQAEKAEGVTVAEAFMRLEQVEELRRVWKLKLAGKLKEVRKSELVVIPKESQGLIGPGILKGAMALGRVRRVERS
jgi:hypothetical protein